MWLSPSSSGERPCPFIYLTLFTCKGTVIKNKREEMFSLSNCRVNFSSKSPLLNRSAIKPDISNIWTLTWKARTILIYKYTDDKSNIKLPESIAPTTKPGSSSVDGNGEQDGQHYFCEVDNTLLYSLVTITASLTQFPKDIIRGTLFLH